jgi:hypothetical protein
MRYRGAGRNWWPTIFLVAIAIVAVVAIYFFFLAPR